MNRPSVVALQLWACEWDATRDTLYHVPQCGTCEQQFQSTHNLIVLKRKKAQMGYNGTIHQKEDKGSNYSKSKKMTTAGLEPATFWYR
jgi:hypothetical protein